MTPNPDYWNAKPAKRSRQDSYESERHDPVAFWYAEAFSQR